MWTDFFFSLKNGSFRKRGHRDNHMIVLPEFSPNTNPKWPAVIAFLNFHGKYVRKKGRENIRLLSLVILENCRSEVSIVTNSIQLNGIMVYYKKLVKLEWCYTDCKQLLDEVFVISRTIKVEVRVSSRNRWLRLISLTYQDLDYSGYHKNRI